MLSGRVLSALHILCKARILTVGPGLKSGIKLRLDNPAQLGAELLCGAVAALSECSGPLVVISADTAISMMAVNAKQELVGGVILPGPQLSLSALVKNTAQLPQIDLAAKAPASILGKSTSSCLQNGFVLGTASLLDGLAERFCAELGPQTAFYATGILHAFAHETKTPLTSIIGYAELMLSRPAQPQLVQESAACIFREGRRLEGLSRKLMDLFVLEKSNLSLPDFLLPVLNLGSQFLAGFLSWLCHGWSLLSACRHRKRTVDFLGCPCGWLFNFSLLFSNI